MALLIACVLMQDADVAKRVRALTEQLKADELQAADEALAALVKLGPPALPAIRAEAAKADGDVKLRLESAVAQIERAVRREKALGKPVAVSLKADARPLVDVLTELRNHSGQPIDWRDLPDGKVTVTLDKAGFWEALDAVCRAHGGVLWGVKSERLAVERAPYRTRPTVFAGNAVFWLDSLATTATAGEGSLAIRGGAATTAGSRPRWLALTFDALEDDKGTPFIDAEGGPEWAVGPPALAQQIDYTAGVLPNEAAEKLAKCRGALRLTYVLDTKKLLSLGIDKARGAAHAAGDASVTVRDIDVEGRRVTMKVEAARKGAAFSELDASWVIVDRDGKTHLGRPEVVDAAAQEDDAGGRTVETYSVTWTLGAKEEAAAFEIVVPSEFEERLIPFDFQGLPLNGEPAKPAARAAEPGPRTSFREVARIVDLTRAEAEKAAAGLPAFYRDAVLDDLKARERLGDRFGRDARISIDAKADSVDRVINALKRGSGIPINAEEPQDVQAARITLKLDDVPLMEALAAVCREAKLTPFMANDSIACVYDSLGFAATSAYRDFLVVLQPIERAWETDFGGSSRGRFGVQLVLIRRPETPIVGIGGVELVEAADDKGRALERTKPPWEAEPEATTVWNAGEGHLPRLFLTWPGRDASKIARLRGSVAVRFALETSRFEFAAPKEGEQRADDHYELTVTGAGGTGFAVRVKPKGGIEELKKAPVELRVRMKGLDEAITYASVHPEEAAIIYLVPVPVDDEGHAAGVVESAEVLIHRTTVERKIRFEFVDVPLK